MMGEMLRRYKEAEAKRQAEWDGLDVIYAWLKEYGEWYTGQRQAALGG